MNKQKFQFSESNDMCNETDSMDINKSNFRWVLFISNNIGSKIDIGISIVLHDSSKVDY